MSFVRDERRLWAFLLWGLYRRHGGMPQGFGLFRVLSRSLLIAILLSAPWIGAFLFVWSLIRPGIGPVPRPHWPTVPEQAFVSVRALLVGYVIWITILAGVLHAFVIPRERRSISTGLRAARLRESVTAAAALTVPLVCLLWVPMGCRALAYAADGYLILQQEYFGKAAIWWLRDALTVASVVVACVLLVVGVRRAARILRGESRGFLVLPPTP